MDSKYYSFKKEELLNGKIKVLLKGDNETIFKTIAREMVDEIIRKNKLNERTVFIVPVGPVGQYPEFVRLVNEERVSLKNVWFINMDEYLSDDFSYIDINSKLSFRGFMDKNVYSKIDPELVMNVSHRVFPDPKNPEAISKLIAELGGVDIAFGGVGINGHLAFNEAEEVSEEIFKTRPTRVLKISNETITANAIGDLNGAIDKMPKYAITVGMKEILSARKIRLGVFRAWHRAVIRRAIFDSVSGSFPVTLVQNHNDALIYVSDIASEVAF